MKAAVYERYGPPGVVRIEEVAKPTIGDDDVLIKVRATTVSSGDWRVRSLDMPAGFSLLARPMLGLFGPRQRILGSELAGDIEAIGRNVTKFKVGDAVVGNPGIGMGCHAEFKAMPAKGAIVPKPANLSHDEAAALSFGGSTALHFLRTKGMIRRGEKVLVVGASGTVGGAAIQLARHFGAEVTGVCSAANLDLVKSIGAHKAIDYTREDFTRNGESYDIILIAAGTGSFARFKGSLRENGRLLQVVGGLPQIAQIPWAAVTSSKRVFAGPAAESAQDLDALRELAEAGAFRPVIDRRYPFDRIVEAHAYVDTGHKKGSVVITM
ncbi:MAG: NAD(P)-dependent alcohol dehydrogenase [Reyranella sp.]|nr:NAD(P)-dependent alcohol dehydrogenase [Reyranella sp.]